VPYPAPWISKEVHKRIFLTSLLRAIAGPERSAYFHVWLHARSDAKAWAARTSESYLALQTYWSGMMSALWCNESLAESIVRTGTPVVPRRRKMRRHNGRGREEGMRR
jgi:hypothetical protein